MLRLSKLERRVRRALGFAPALGLALYSLLGSSTAGLSLPPSWPTPLDLDLDGTRRDRPQAAPTFHLLPAPGAPAVRPFLPESFAPPQVARPEGPTPPRAAGPRLVSPLPYHAEIRRVAQRHALDERLLASLVEVESGFRADAVSPRGARGLMQLMPATGRQYGLAEAFDPEANLDAGARYLKDLQHQFRGNLEHTLAAYLVGPTTVTRWGSVPAGGETQRYVARILALYEQRGGVLAPPPVVAAGLALGPAESAGLAASARRAPGSPFSAAVGAGPATPRPARPAP